MTKAELLVALRKARAKGTWSMKNKKVELEAALKKAERKAPPGGGYS